MANPVTTIETLEVKNISQQIVPIFIKPKIGSPIYIPSGKTDLAPGGSVVAEDARFDKKQLESIQRKKLIKVTPGQRQVNLINDEVGTSGSLGG